MTEQSKDAFRFHTVLSGELDTLNLRRVKTFEPRPEPDETDEQREQREALAFTRAHDANLTGLAFSGGGIRSATFNLGVMQGLAKVRKKDAKEKNGLLSRFDYLSTVSGGGYIGSWLSAWIHRDAEDLKEAGEPVGEEFLNGMQKKISTRPCDFDSAESLSSKEVWREKSGFDEKPTTCGFPPLEHAAVRYLRRYSNYLAPRLGLSGDTLSLISLFLRNLVALQLALFTFIAIFIFAGRTVAVVSEHIALSNETLLLGPLDANGLLSVGLLVLVFVLAACGLEIRYFGARKKEISRRLRRRIPAINAALALLCLIGAWIVVMSGMVTPGIAPFKYFVLTSVVVYSLIWLFVFKRSSRPFKTLFMKQKLRLVLVPVVTGSTLGAIAYASANVLKLDVIKHLLNFDAVVMLGPPIMLLVLSFVITVHIIIAGDAISQAQREWWARFGGFVLYAGVLWTGLMAISLYADDFVRWLGDTAVPAVIAWLGASGGGAWLARQAGKEGSQEETSAVKMALTRVVINLAPWLFVIGLAIVVSLSVGWILDTLPTIEALREFDADNWYPAAGTVSTLVIFLAIAWFLDINIFSLHTLYRNRLVRAYLGASRVDDCPSQDPFTAFDEEDDLRLVELDDQRPIPLVNGTINMTGGSDLAWQTRRAASFTFTPSYVGYEAKSTSGTDLGGFRRTRDYASGFNEDVDKDAKTGLSLGTAMAISGAAASPNMGYNTSSGIAALLTMFNMRLGYWAGNPSKKPEWRKPGTWGAWRKKGPLLAARPIWQDLTGSADAESPWVNLTDGGHFDNLGIYELVRRRCRLIVVTDAGCDPKHKFRDLANAIRLCWTDLGVHIYMPSLDLISFENEGDRAVRSHGCFGLIEYADRERDDPQRYGLILYLKASLTDTTRASYADIRQSAEVNKAYPHETTGDQFFDENQFEAYRHLGFCIAANVKRDLGKLFEGQTSEIRIGNGGRFDGIVKLIRARQKNIDKVNYFRRIILRSLGVDPAG